MIYDDKGNILVQDRKNKDWPGITFPGGHVEAGESFTKAVIREVWEETGLTIQQPKICGVKQFQTIENERYLVFLYKTNHFTGEIQSSEEGEIFWIAREQLINYELASDFEEMMKVFESDHLSEFYYSQNGKNNSWKLDLL